MPLLASETFVQGTQRLTRDLQVAMNLLTKQSGTPAESWKDAKLAVEQGLERERRAIASVGVFAGKNNGALGTIASFSKRLDAKQNAILADLQSYYHALHNTNPGQIKLTEQEAAAAKKIPANTPVLEDYFGRRGKVRFRSKMHNIMRSEVFNFVDGKRSYYDIYKAVRAEAMHAGEWYYGTVELADVTGLLDAAVEAQALILK